MGAHNCPSRREGCHTLNSYKPNSSSWHFYPEICTRKTVNKNPIKSERGQIFYCLVGFLGERGDETTVWKFLLFCGAGNPAPPDVSKERKYLFII